MRRHRRKAKGECDEPVVAFELNPLAPLIGRVSSTFEILPARHHAFVATPYFRRGDATGLDVTQGAFTHAWTVAYATELGYRFYSAREGPHGFYIGPSIVLGEQWNAHGAEGDRYGRSLVLGFIADIGGQVRAGDFIVGAGAGVALSSEKFCSSPCVGALLARILLSVGWVLSG
jgi:hypothetical protein